VKSIVALLVAAVVVAVGATLDLVVLRIVAPVRYQQVVMVLLCPVSYLQIMILTIAHQMAFLIPLENIAALPYVAVVMEVGVIQGQVVPHHAAPAV